jgi:hypothetical protein
MTGRAAGYCAGYAMPGYMNPMPRAAGVGYGAWGYGAWPGRGAGFWGGRGRRGGRRNWYRATGMPGWARARMGLPAWGGRTRGAYPGAYGGYAPAYSGYPG